MTWPFKFGRIFYLVILFPLVIFSCKKSPDSKIIRIDLNNWLSEGRKIFLSEIASEIHYIPLESKEDSYLGSYRQVTFCNGFIFILDYEEQCIQIFNEKGRHVVKIDRKGKGPGEYSRIYDFGVNSSDSTIFVLDGDQNKIIHYSQSGVFLKEMRRKNNYENRFFIQRDGSILTLILYPNTIFNNDYSINFYNSDLKLLNQQIINENISIEEANNITHWGMCTFDIFYDTLTYWECSKNIVYKLKNGKFIPQYLLDIPNPLYATKGKYKNGNGIFDYLETCNYIFLSGGKEIDTPVRLIYSKRNNETTILSIRYMDKMNYGLINDLDHGWTFYPIGTTPDGKLFDIFSPYKLKEIIRKRSPDKSLNDSALIRYGLKDILENAQPEDNRCIMVVTPK